MSAPRPNPEVTPVPRPHPEFPPVFSPDNTSARDPGLEQMRIRYAFWLAVYGLGVAALLVALLVFRGWEQASDVVAVVGLFTSVLGTLVGAFFGLQMGQAGRDKEQQATKEATRVAMRALAALPPEQGRGIVQ